LTRCMLKPIKHVDSIDNSFPLNSAFGEIISALTQPLVKSFPR
jgi:hypothetical protein